MVIFQLKSLFKPFDSRQHKLMEILFLKSLSLAHSKNVITKFAHGSFCSSKMFMIYKVKHDKNIKRGTFQKILKYIAALFKRYKLLIHTSFQQIQEKHFFKHPSWLLFHSAITIPWREYLCLAGVKWVTTEVPIAKTTVRSKGVFHLKVRMVSSLCPTVICVILFVNAY